MDVSREHCTACVPSDAQRASAALRRARRARRCASLIGGDAQRLTSFGVTPYINLELAASYLFVERLSAKHAVADSEDTNAPTPWRSAPEISQTVSPQGYGNYTTHVNYFSFT